MKKRIFAIVLAMLMFISSVTTASAAVSGFSLDHLPGTKDNVSNLPESVYYETEGEASEITVSRQTPVREGYCFMGWILDYHITRLLFGEIRWDDNNNAAGMRPDSVSVSLFKFDGAFDPAIHKAIQTAVASSASGWKFSFDISDEELFTPAGAPYKFGILQGNIGIYQELADMHVEPSLIQDGLIVNRTLPVEYTVRYLMEDTEIPVADPKTGSGMPGASVTEAAIEVSDFIPSGKTTDSIVLSGDPSENVITFYYKAATVPYTVKYVDRDNNPLLDPKIIEDQTIGTEIVEEAINIRDYVLYDEPEKRKILSANPDDNVFVFVYTLAPVDYTVMYLDRATNSRLLDDKTIYGTPIGTLVTEEAEAIEGFTLDDDDVKTMTLTNDPSRNVIPFYYIMKKTSYRVEYIDKTTGDILDSKDVTDVNIGANITEMARDDFEGYSLAAGEVSSKSIVTDKDPDNNIFKFYYEPSESFYIVRYVLNGTDTDIATPETITGVRIGDRVRARMISIPGYAISGKTSYQLTIDIDNSKNVIIFYYDPQL